MTRARLVRAPIEPARLLAAVADASHGATALFLGTVRDHNDGRAVLGIEYSAYDAMAERELEAIATEAEARFGVRVRAEHRLGTLELGDVSVAAAVAHARRAAAFDALRYVVEELKRRVPIWKRELYADGSRAWVSAATEPAAAAGGAPR